MRKRCYVVIVLCLGLLWFLFAANNSVGSSEPDQSVSKLVQLIEKLTERIEAFEQLVRILEARVQSLEAEKVRESDSESGGKGETIEWYQVRRVIDGDTIELVDGTKVRYLGINTPEVGQPGAEEATEANRALVEGKKVRLECDTPKKQDKYGRALAYVYVDDTFINGELLRKGLAEINTYKQKLKHLDALIKCQREAIKNQRGIWKGVQPQDIIYITETGNKYHRVWCSYLNQNAIPTTRERAIAQGYGEACKVCKPAPQ